jgi:Holliday junction resolvase RusA-like endonuclease
VVGVAFGASCRKRGAVGKAEAASMTGELVADVDVRFRPATYATAGEKPWRLAVASALDEAGVAPRLDGWFAVWIAFRTAEPVRATEAWDLDNLVKSTLDAMSLVFGARAWKGVAQPNDDRVVDLHATKRQVRPGEVPGAKIVARVVDLPV